MRQGGKPHAQEKLSRLSELVEPWFIFSLVWSVGCTGDAGSYQRFSAWLRGKMAKENVRICLATSHSADLPTNQLLYHRQ